MSFRDFLGNEIVVQRLREAIASGRLPPAMILAGPRGAGKYTLAVRLAQAVNCLDPKETDGQPDYCGVCSNCVRIGEAINLDTLVDQAVAAREELREVDKKETRILIQTHPDMLVIPPDPPQLLIKLGQVRTVIREIYRMPAEASRAFYICFDVTARGLISYLIERTAILTKLCLRNDLSLINDHKLGMKRMTHRRMERNAIRPRAV